MNQRSVFSSDVFVMTSCEYFRKGMQELFISTDVSLHFISRIDQVVVSQNDTLTILLVLDMSSSESLRTFRDAVEFLGQINCRCRVGVLVSRYNAWMTGYISRKFSRKVTFFNSHNLQSGLFQRNFLSWLKGKTFRPMHTVYRFRDNRYGFSQKEWVSLVIPLSGESMQEISACLNVPVYSMYQVRRNALRKIGVSSWREFCELFINGEIRTENSGASRV